MEFLSNFLPVFWKFSFPILARTISGAVFVEGAISLWRKDRYSWRRALALFFIIDAVPGILRRCAGAIADGILESIKIWS